MTKEDRIEFSAAIKRVSKRMLQDKEYAKAFFVRAGIITPKGNLRKPYRHLCIALGQA